MFGSFFRNNFVRGFGTGVATRTTYDYVQNSLYGQDRNSTFTKALDNKLASYDTNHDGQVTLGEIVDGITTDIRKYEISTKPVITPNPAVVFVTKKIE